MTNQPLEPMQEIDVKAIVALLRRQVWLIGLSTLLVLAIAAAYLVTARPIYTATSLVLVDPNSKSLVYSEIASVSGASENARVDSEVEILRTPSVALAVVRDQSLITDPEFGPKLGLGDKIRQALGFETSQDQSGDSLVKAVLVRFMEAVEVRRRGITYLIAVSVKSESPDRAAELSNALTQAYISAQVESKISSTLAARDKLQSQIAAAQAALSQGEGAIDGFIDTNLARIEAESGRSDIEALRLALTAADDKRLAANVRVQDLQTKLAAGDWATLTAGLGDAALAALQSQREALQRQLDGVPIGSTDDVNLRAALAQLDARQQERAAAAISRVEGEAAALAQSTQDLRGQIRQTLLSGTIPSEVLTELYGLQQEATIARSQYNLLLSRMRELEIQAAVQIADSRVVSPALPPNSPSYPNKRMALALALVAGLGLGVGLAFLNEYYIGGITTENQLRDVLHARVATAIPLITLKGETQRSIADSVITDPLSPYSESIRRLRATIDLSFKGSRAEATSASGDEGRVIVVTSSIPAEGKSTTALALARAFAQANRRVLLIDADLRKPTMHKLLGISAVHGLADWLHEPSSEELGRDLIVKDSISTVSLALGAGRAHAETDQLLGGEAFGTLLQMARGAFDITIIDTPPLLPVVDARYLAGYGDTLVMVVRFGVTSQSDVRSAMAMLNESKSPNAEVIAALNHQPSSAKSYRYAGYYTDYSGGDA
ncbi:Wzz/FepE/Etk N-terminal domain-containing protein [Phaeovulum sp.]|uniref:Wzz/FepE/Etk N-terminal domain-containing protein n=1 Tax=Phaeovulum sp. TaxID=2934796 RepID=UPI002730E709|nr:Wzz/FepE/Etk N-terminal domain-containing protein [Phaeovulum sp.]MDP1669075.1 Wzz/FepE/Etk N-terminal domain-containing protein [Phaeovulum sp.]MDP2062095.1 Wzz/FepE/Etk N-terminal domain-containing protein [Phaeovulum sp.]MDP3860097.1 Wzz/FepE/Etk N-terminal domain-containing protein [Phaeovulum sp.]MDZ4117714.1 Wzz/FepE/Etk N-terminal domain-containing protein [Phaeovulum sp.]